MKLGIDLRGRAHIQLFRMDHRVPTPIVRMRKIGLQELGGWLTVYTGLFKPRSKWWRVCHSRGDCLRFFFFVCLSQVLTFTFVPKFYIIININKHYTIIIYNNKHYIWCQRGTLLNHAKMACQPLPHHDEAIENKTQPSPDHPQPAFLHLVIF